jgi:hypothetical protein
VALPHPQAALSVLRSGPVSRFVPRPCGAEGGTIYLYQGDAGYAASDPQVAGARHRLIAIGPSWHYERSD